MPPVAERLGEWASASRTFSTITALFAVVQSEVATLLVLIPSPSMLHFLILPACLLIFCRQQLLSRRQGITPDDKWFGKMAHLFALRYGGKSASTPGCLCDCKGTLYCLFCFALP